MAVPGQLQCEQEKFKQESLWLHRPVVAASPGSSLEMQNPGLHPRSAGSETAFYQAV